MEHNDTVERAFFTYVPVTWRRRWFLADGESFMHFGLGAGPAFFWETNEVRKWNPEVGWTYDGETAVELGTWIFWHAELLATRRLRDGLDLRGGVTFTPLLYLPLSAQPVLMAVWRF